MAAVQAERLKVFMYCIVFLALGGMEQVTCVPKTTGFERGSYSVLWPANARF